MLKNRSRYTIHQTLSDIDQWTILVKQACKDEDMWRDHYTDCLYYKFHCKDDHDLDKYRHIRWYNNDLEQYTLHVRKRMKIQKYLRLLNERLDRLISYHKRSVCEKLLLINDVLISVDLDCKNYIKQLIFSFFNFELYQY